MRLRCRFIPHNRKTNESQQGRLADALVLYCARANSVKHGPVWVDSAISSMRIDRQKRPCRFLAIAVLLFSAKRINGADDHPVLATFALPNHNLAPLEICILDTNLDALHQAHAVAIEQSGACRPLIWANTRSISWGVRGGPPGWFFGAVDTLDAWYLQPRHLLV